MIHYSYDIPNNDQETSKKLFQAIIKSGKSYGDISNATGLSKSVIQRYATGGVSKIPIGRLTAIYRTLGIDIEIDDNDRKLLESFHSAPENIQTAIWTLLTPYSEK